MNANKCVGQQYLSVYIYEGTPCPVCWWCNRLEGIHENVNPVSSSSHVRILVGPTQILHLWGFFQSSRNISSFRSEESTVRSEPVPKTYSSIVIQDHRKGHDAQLPCHDGKTTLSKLQPTQVYTCSSFRDLREFVSYHFRGVRWYLYCILLCHIFTSHFRFFKMDLRGLEGLSQSDLGVNTSSSLLSCVWISFRTWRKRSDPSGISPRSIFIELDLPLDLQLFLLHRCLSEQWFDVLHVISSPL